MDDARRPGFADYTPALGEEICRQLTDNGMRLTDVAAMPGMPYVRTVMEWRHRHPDFMEMYQKARDAVSDRWAEEIIEIADDATNDWMERQRQDGSTTESANMEHIQRSKLRIETRRWLMSKFGRKTYGEVQKVEQSGPDGGPIVTRVERVVVDPKDESTE